MILGSFLSEIIPNHAYSILNCKDENGKKSVQVRNPHAIWGDQESKSKDMSEDGKIWIPFQTWAKNFNGLYVCTLHHSVLLRKDPTTLVSPSLVTIQGRWTGDSAGGCSQFGSWRDNPQYCLRAKDGDRGKDGHTSVIK